MIWSLLSRVRQIWLFLENEEYYRPFDGCKIEIYFLYQKTQNFTMISNPLKKLLNTAPKKVISKTSLTNMSKSEKSAYFRHVFANNFFWCIFSKLSQRIRHQREILRFLIPILNFWEKKFSFALFSTFCKLQMRSKRLKKTENLFLWKCLRI